MKEGQKKGSRRGRRVKEERKGEERNGEERKGKEKEKEKERKRKGEGMKLACDFTPRSNVSSFWTFPVPQL